MICEWFTCFGCNIKYSSELKSCPYCGRKKGEEVMANDLMSDQPEMKIIDEKKVCDTCSSCGTIIAGHGHPKFYALLDVMADLHSRKNHDYSGDDPLSNLRASEEIGIPAWKGILVRLMDKWGRLRQFAKTKTLKVKDESVIDTLMDNAVYSLLCIILYEENKNNE